MASAKLAFYVAKHGNIVDKAIAWWTNSLFSHVELVCCGDWYSTSPRDLKVRKKRIEPTVGHWIFVDVEVDPMFLEDFFFLTEGRKYDWTGIFLTQFLPLRIHSKSRYFCSEWCAKALQLSNAHHYSPEDLYQLTRKR